MESWNMRVAGVAEEAAGAVPAVSAGGTVAIARGPISSSAHAATVTIRDVTRGVTGGDGSTALAGSPPGLRAILVPVTLHQALVRGPVEGVEHHRPQHPGQEVPVAVLVELAG